MKIDTDETGNGRSRSSSDDDVVREMQRKQGVRLVTTLVVLLIISMYLFIDVRTQAWGWPFHTIGAEDYIWLQWLFAGLVGTLLGQLWQASKGFEKVKIQPPRLEVKAMIDRGEPTPTPWMTTDDFIQKTPTFILNVIRGPIIVLVVLFALTNISLATALIPADASQPALGEVDTSAPDEASPSEPDAAAAAETDAGTVEGNTDAAASDESAASLEGIPLGIAIDLRNAKPDVLVILAFVLGYYQKLAVTLLNQIARGVFGKAWEEAYADEEDETEEPQDGDK